MRIGRFSSFSLLLLLTWVLPVWILPAASQDSASSSSAPQVSITEEAPAPHGSATASMPPPPASFNDVLDRVVQREHLFLA